MRSNGRKRKAGSPKKRLRCRIDKDGLRCDLSSDPVERAIENESIQPGCYVDLERKQWHCPTVPGLHGRRADGVEGYHTDPVFGQGWAMAGDKKVPVAAFPVEVGRRTQGVRQMSRNKKTSTFQRILSRFGLGGKSSKKMTLRERTVPHSWCGGKPPQPGMICKCVTKLDGSETCGWAQPKIIFPSPKKSPRQALAVGCTATCGCSKKREANPSPNRMSLGAPTPLGAFMRQPNPKLAATSPGTGRRGPRGIESELATDISPGVVKGYGRGRGKGYGRGYGSGPIYSNPTSPAVDCCYDEGTGRLVCPTLPDYDGQQVTVVAEFLQQDGSKGVSVMLPTGEGVRIPVCAPQPDYDPDPGPEDIACCFLKSTGQIVCEDPDHPWHMIVPPEHTVTFGDHEGTEHAWVLVGGDSHARMPVCPEPDDEPDPEEIPFDCCFLRSTSEIICADENHAWHRVVVPAERLSFVSGSDGEYAVVEIEGAGQVRFLVCPEPEIECPPGTDIDEHGRCTPKKKPEIPPKRVPSDDPKCVLLPRPGKHTHPGGACCDSCAQGKECEGSCSTGG